MDITEKSNLFSNRTQMQKFVKKDLIRVDPSQPIVNTATRINFDLIAEY